MFWRMMISWGGIAGGRRGDVLGFVALGGYGIRIRGWIPIFGRCSVFVQRRWWSLAARWTTIDQKSIIVHGDLRPR